MNLARVSPLQTRIIELRDTAKLSWSVIARQVSVEFEKQVSAGNCCTYYQRATATLRGYQDIAAKQAEWDDPKNRAQRYSRRAWKKLPKAQQKALWRLSPYPPDPVRRALDLPRRAPKKYGEELVAAKQKLIEHLRSKGDEESLIRARSLEKSQSMSSESLSPATCVPTAPQRVAEPIQPVSAAPVPKPRTICSAYARSVAEDRARHAHLSNRRSARRL